MNVLDTRQRDLSPVAVERLLLEAANRAARQSSGRVALVLHLSRLRPPSPRPHHRRIARALLQDTAARHDGQVFVLRNEDMVLLCRIPPGALAAPRPAVAESLRVVVAEPLALPDIMGRLLQADTLRGSELVSVWPMETDAGRLVAYATDRLSQSGEATVMDDDVAGQIGMMDAIGALVGTAAISDLMQRQTAILLPGGADPHGRRPQPLFREVTFSIAALEARIATTCHAGADPFLFRYLAARMDQRMLHVLQAQMGSGGPLDVLQSGSGGRAGAPEPQPVLHLNLTLPGVLSQAFTRFAEACGSSGTSLGVEISLIEAAADPVRFAQARAMANAAGLTLVLDGVSYLSLLMARPWALQPDLLKLDWSPRLADLTPGDSALLDDALAQIDPSRIVLHRAETEAAMRWGLARGIRRFQGRHVDAMLGASRIVDCAHADQCTLRQCIERAAATGSAGRAGCHNMALLDAGAPPPAPARPIAPSRSQERVA